MGTTSPTGDKIASLPCLELGPTWGGHALGKPPTKAKAVPKECPHSPRVSSGAGRAGAFTWPGAAVSHGVSKTSTYLRLTGEHEELETSGDKEKGREQGAWLGSVVFSPPFPP